MTSEAYISEQQNPQKSEKKQQHTLSHIAREVLAYTIKSVGALGEILTDSSLYLLKHPSRYDADVAMEKTRKYTLELPKAFQKAHVSLNHRRREWSGDTLAEQEVVESVKRSKYPWIAGQKDEHFYVENLHDIYDEKILHIRRVYTTMLRGAPHGNSDDIYLYKDGRKYVHKQHRSVWDKKTRETKYVFSRVEITPYPLFVHGDTRALASSMRVLSHSVHAIEKALPTLKYTKRASMPL